MIDLDKEIMRVEREWITKALLETGGKKMQAAKLLNISWRSMRYRLAKHFGMKQIAESLRDF